MPDHRQLGAKLGKCTVCKSAVWSAQPNVLTQVTPATFAHKSCVRETRKVIQ